jgi:hypothetical protein
MNVSAPCTDGPGLRAARRASFALLLLATPLAARATVFTFDLEGKAGAGLLSGNENGTINGSPGTGGEFGAGIFYDDVTNLLTINVAWGSVNGFTNLSGNASAAHVHGPTVNTGTGSFTQNASVLFGLDGAPFIFNNSSSSGFISGTSNALSGANETALFAGQLYINVHTSTNPGGEIRGNLVNPIAIPEPASYAAFGGFAALGLALLRRRRAA